MKITEPRNRKEKKEIYDIIGKSDSLVSQARHNLFSIDRKFHLKRDKELLENIINKLEWCNNKLLLLEGRIIYEIGSNMYMDRQYLQFRVRHYPKDADYRTKKFISLSETSYDGHKFKAFMDKKLGAKAEIIVHKGKKIILIILIPIEHKNKIKY